MDRKELALLQQSCDLVAAEELFRGAFWRDVRPLAAAWREAHGLPADPRWPRCVRADMSSASAANAWKALGSKQLRLKKVILVCNVSVMKLSRGGKQLPRAKIKRLYLIPILSKALDVLELLEQKNAPVTLEDVFQETHISKTSVYRILKTLVHRGYVAQSQTGQYRLVSRPRRLRFGFAVQSAEMPFSMAVATERDSGGGGGGRGSPDHLDNRQDPDIAIQNAEEFVDRAR